MSSTEESGGSSSSSGRATPGLPLPPLTTQQVLVAAAATAPVLSLEQRQLLAGAAPALDQLASVINEVIRVIAVVMPCVPVWFPMLLCLVGRHLHWTNWLLSSNR
jgi:hypothetical protein